MSRLILPRRELALRKRQRGFILPGSLGVPRSPNGPPQLTMALLHFDGSNGSTTATDETGRVWTANGNAQISTAQSQYGGASGLFDGSGDFFSAASDSQLNLTGTDFTIEAWIYANSTGTYRSIIAKRDQNPPLDWQFVLNNSDNKLLYAGGNPNTSALSTGQITLNTWTHVAMTMTSGGTLKFWIGGTLDSTHTGLSVYSSSQSVRIGANFYGSVLQEPYLGYIDELRIRKELVYTSNFTPAGPFSYP